MGFAANPRRIYISYDVRFLFLFVCFLHKHGITTRKKNEKGSRDMHSIGHVGSYRFEHGDGDGDGDGEVFTCECVCMCS